MSKKLERKYIEDTIAAIATPPGEGAIAIVRLTGPRAIAIAGKVFQGRARLSDIATHTLQHGIIIDPRSGEAIDEVLTGVMHQPGSYTGEDMVEINCHGGQLLSQKILELLLRHGARLATPGEFTRRAFLNGRIDLLQAEAVVDLIRSRAELSLKLAQRQLSGQLSRQIDAIRQELIQSLAVVEAELDFSDQDLAVSASDQVQTPLLRVQQVIEQLLSGARLGEHLRAGFKVVLVGRPNVGKSSLFNALLETDRAIVTPLPGTTRDILAEDLSLAGLPIRLLDTAGLHAPEGLIEKEGVRRTRAQMVSADLLVVILDGSEHLMEEDREILLETEDHRNLLVINKSDLSVVIEAESLKKTCPAQRIMWTSATRGDGLRELSAAIREELCDGQGAQLAEPLISTARHREALERTSEMVRQALRQLQNGANEELVAVDLRSALEALGEITGETCHQEILDRIFSQFCIGK